MIQMIIRVEPYCLLEAVLSASKKPEVHTCMHFRQSDHVQVIIKASFMFIIQIMNLLQILTSSIDSKTICTLAAILTPAQETTLYILGINL